MVGDELTAGEVVEEGALADDVRFVELAPPEDFGPVTVTVGPDDVSLLFIARGADIDDEVYIDEITGPDGERYDAPLELQPSNFGETAVLLPLFADQPLVPGEYTFFVGSDAGLTRPRQPIRTWNDGTKITGHKLELIETGGHARKRPFPGVSVRPRSAG